MTSTILLPAVVGILSASLSALIAYTTIRRNSLDRRLERSQQTAVVLLPRRLEAYEELWRSLIEIERVGSISPDMADKLARFTIWLPSELRDATLRLILGEEQSAGAVSNIRSELLRDVAISNIDDAMQRLTDGGGNGKRR